LVFLRSFEAANFVHLFLVIRVERGRHVRLTLRLDTNAFNCLLVAVWSLIIWVTKGFVSRSGFFCSASWLD
jgi:hypothetical protein